MAKTGEGREKGGEKVITFLSGWTCETTLLKHECLLHRIASDPSMGSAMRDIPRRNIEL